jgi:hypothetical protein
VSLRAQRAEGDTSQDGGDKNSALRYEVSRLKRRNEVLGEEVRFLKKRGYLRFFHPPRKGLLSPLRRRAERERERRRRE